MKVVHLFLKHVVETEVVVLKSQNERKKETGDNCWMEYQCQRHDVDGAFVAAEPVDVTVAAVGLPDDDVDEGQVVWQHLLQTKQRPLCESFHEQ